MLGLRRQGTVELSLAGIWDGRGVPETPQTQPVMRTSYITSLGTVGNSWERVQLCQRLSLKPGW